MRMDHPSGINSLLLKHIGPDKKHCLKAVGFQPCYEFLIMLFISSVGVFIMYMRQPHTTNSPIRKKELYWLSPVNKLVLGVCQRALTSQGRIEIQARLTIPVCASRPISLIAPANSMDSQLVMLPSWQTRFMTSILVTSSQCGNYWISQIHGIELQMKEFRQTTVLAAIENFSKLCVTGHLSPRSMDFFCRS